MYVTGMFRNLSKGKPLVSTPFSDFYRCYQTYLKCIFGFSSNPTTKASKNLDLGQIKMIAKNCYHFYS